MSASADEEGIRRLKIIGRNLQPAEAGFVCVAAVSTAGVFGFLDRCAIAFLGGWAIAFLGGWAIGFLGEWAIGFLGEWAIAFFCGWGDRSNSTNKSYKPVGAKHSGDNF